MIGWLYASAFSSCGGSEPMNAADHFRPVYIVMRSLITLRVKAGAAVEKETHGEVRTRARKGVERVMGWMGAEVEG
jgi:hypothetical protein